jgi:dTDP-4-dehydrorhamnose reductase
MKILVIGASGLVGSALMQELEGEVYGTYIENASEKDNYFFLDITNKDAVNELLKKLVPDLVVLTAAFTWVDGCEEFKDKAYKINVKGTKNVVDACKEINAKLVFFSSDYIFDGSGGPYDEQAVINPLNYYGETKAAGEKLIKKLRRYLIIRTTWVFDWPEEKNFFSRLIRSLKTGERAKVPHDQFGNPTYAINLAQAVNELIKKEKCGTYNVVGKDYMSRYDFACRIASFFGLNEKLIIPVSTQELNQKARRPKKAGFVTDKAQKELSIKLLKLEEALRLIKQKMQNE